MKKSQIENLSRKNAEYITNITKSALDNMSLSVHGTHFFLSEKKEQNKQLKILLNYI